MAKELMMNFASDMSLMKKALNIILAQVKKNKPYVPDEDYQDLHLIFTELLTNAIIHGNKCNSCKKVYIFVGLTEEGVRAKITDEGNGFNYVEVLNPRNSNKDLLPKTGNGLTTVRSLTDGLVFYDKGNEVIFYKNMSHRMDCTPYTDYIHYASNF